ncbi:SRPBCC family protein [Sphingobium sp. CCH11-B1]|uniref:SRPBCC family protein n=1 Tax=Sphingobium sp. CCH11-B1 TaxID=1768781 RepID=UPI000836AA6E|nr:SRPBCC domain-containing protein [Sphingobium sp. CCH11-B1]
MVTLQHAIKIAAPRARIYHALTDIDAMAGWHLGAITGAISKGDIFYLERRPGLRFGWRTDDLEVDQSVVQTCVEGPGAQDGKRLTITLSDLPDGRTLVELNDEGWAEDHPHLALCNTYWGEALTNLKSYVEKT